MGKYDVVMEDEAGHSAIPCQRLKSGTYLRVALPFMLSTVTQPLLGAVDTAVIGLLGDAAAIAGVSLGANLFNTLYWLFGFLRVSTTGLSAQIQEQDQDIARGRTFFLPLIMALLVAIVFLVLQYPVLLTYLQITAPELLVKQYVQQYYQILIWGAPFVLVNYVMLGWLMGQSRVSASLFMQISGNVVNMVLDYWFVCGLGLGIEGVAAATLISQIYTFICGTVGMLIFGKFGTVKFSQLWNKGILAELLLVNRDLLLRTVCLVIHNNVFAALSTRLGTDILAVNAILLQITSIQAYLFEGLANSSSVFAGKAAGCRCRELMDSVIKLTWQWGMVLAVIISGSCMLLGNELVSLFTGLPHILQLATCYMPYCWIYPIVAMAGLSLYGVYTGSYVTEPVFLSTLWALLLCLPICFIGAVTIGNDGLWLGYLVFYGGRSLGLIVYRRRLWLSITDKRRIA